VNLEKFPDYLALIDDPQDLSTIEARLKNREYRSVREWKRDIGLIWENALAYNGGAGPIGFIVTHLKGIMEKEIKEFSRTTLTGWLNSVTELKEKLNSVLGNVPTDKVKESAPLELMPRKSLKPLLPDDYREVFQALNDVHNPGVGGELSEIVGKIESERQLMSLPLDKLCQARDFVALRKSHSQKPLLGVRGPDLLLE
jgi:hypothetical protein